MFSFRPKTQKIIFSFLLIALISSLGIFVFGVEPAYAWTEWLNPVTWLKAAIGWILKIILFIFGLLLAGTAQIFDWTLGIAHFTDAPAVVVGWGIVRDLVNMLLVLILMAIAFATILGIQSYGIKALLPKLIIVALLVNFSLVVAGVIIDFTQVVANFFVDQAGGGSFALSIVKGLSILDALQAPEGFIQSVAQTPSTIWDTFVYFLIGLIGGIVIILTATVMFALGAFLLLIRVMALWILLILLPGALLCMILPATRNLWNKWIHSFFKWAFFAPVYAFFVYLALVTVQGGAMLQQVSSNSTALDQGWTGPNFFNSFFGVETILTYVMVFGLLTGGLVAARLTGIYGADGTIKVAKWVGKGAAGLASRELARVPMPGAQRMGGWITRLGEIRAAGRRARGLEEGRLAERLKAGGELMAKTRGRGVLSPGAWRRTWPAYRKEIEAIAYARPTGALRDQLGFVLSLGRARTSFEDQAVEAEVNRRKQEYAATNRSTSYLQSELGKAVAAGHQVNTSALLRLIVEQNDQNDLIIDTPFGKPVGHVYSDENFTTVAYNILNQVGFTDEQQAKIAMDLGNIAYMSGNYMNFGMGRYDAALRRFRRATIEEQREAAARKASGVKAQTKADMLHWNTFAEAVPISIDPSGIGNLHGGGRESLRWITDSEMGQFNRLRRDFIEKIGSDKIVHQARNFADEVERGDVEHPADSVQAGLIRKFAAQLEALKTGRKPAWYDESRYGALRWVT